MVVRGWGYLVLGRLLAAEGAQAAEVVTQEVVLVETHPEAPLVVALGLVMAVEAEPVKQLALAEPELQAAPA